MEAVFLQTEERWWKASEDNFFPQILLYHLSFVTGEWKLLLWSAEFCDAQVCLGRLRCDHHSACKMRSFFSAVSPNFHRGQDSRRIWSFTISSPWNTPQHILSHTVSQWFLRYISNANSFAWNWCKFVSLCRSFFFLMAMFASQQLPSLMFFRYQLLAPNILLAADQFIFHSLLHLSRDRNRYVLLCFLIALFLVKKSPCFIKVLYRQREPRGEREGAAVLVGSINSHLPLALL